jgi:hypothetical protein
MPKRSFLDPARTVIGVLVASTSMLTGCATILGPRTHQISVDSAPSGANVWVDGSYAGTTPLVVKIDRGRPADIALALDGERQRCAIPMQLSGGWLVVDLVFGLIPLIVDAATGDWYQPAFQVCSVSFPRLERRPQRPVEEERPDDQREPEEAPRAPRYPGRKPIVPDAS